MELINTVHTQVLRVLKGKSYISDPHKYWEKRGVSYRQENEGKGLLEEQVILSQIAGLRPVSILEVGCGYGRILKLTEGLHGIKRSVGIDFSQSMLNEARKYCKSELILADATKLPFEDGEFDLVYTFGVIMHIPNESYKFALSEIKRVAKRHIINYEIPVKNGWHCWDHDYKVFYRTYGIKVLKGSPMFVMEKWEE